MMHTFHRIVRTTGTALIILGALLLPAIADCSISVPTFQKISDTQGGFPGVLDNADHFGVSVVSPGDLEGDGVNDLFVGAFDDDGGSGRGSVYVPFPDTPVTEVTLGGDSIYWIPASEAAPRMLESPVLGNCSESRKESPDGHRTRPPHPGVLAGGL